MKLYLVKPEDQHADSMCLCVPTHIKYFLLIPLNKGISALLLWFQGAN